MASGPFFQLFIVLEKSTLFDPASLLVSFNKVVGKVVIERVDFRSKGLKKIFTFHAYHLFPSVSFYRKNKTLLVKIKPEVRW
jgi:hypothetical protein